MQKLSEEERGAIEMWLKGLEAGASDFYSSTTNDAMRAYQEGQAEAYGHMRELVRESEEDVLTTLRCYMDQTCKAWTETGLKVTELLKQDKARGAFNAARYVVNMIQDNYREPEKWYVVGLAMDKDKEDGTEFYDDEYENYFYRDYEKAKEAFEQAVKAMCGVVLTMDDVLKELGPLTKGGNEVGVQDGYKAVRFQEFDTLPADVDAQHRNEPIDPDYFLEEETVEEE